jgi:diguanylate cyclase (GGDEF)-like protein
MTAWLFDALLTGVFSAARFDLAWYAGRAFEFVAGIVMLIVLLTEMATQYRRLVDLTNALRVSNAPLEELSLRDELTGLSNRRRFDHYLANQIAICRREKRSLALVMYDVDAFKAYNDDHGHQAGDECLAKVAAALASCCRRPADMAVRYGGEEFALILPETGLEGAARIAEQAREAVARLAIPHASSPAAGHVTISGGVAILSPELNLTAEQLIALADVRLFQAKSKGRNRIVSPSMASNNA